MKLSTRTRYGIRAILELAENYGQGPVQIKTIAHRQEISAKYLEQLMALLKSAGFVRSIRGSKGGYLLAKTPSQIKLSDVFNALEGPGITVECVENESYCARAADCVARELWAEVQNAIMVVLQSITLQNLVDRAKENKVLNYHIEGIKMEKNKLTDDKIQELVDEIVRTYEGDSGINFIDTSNLPVRDKILEILDLLIELLFPGYTGKRTVTKSNINFIIGDILYQVYTELYEQLERAFKYRCRMDKCDTGDCQAMAKDATEHLLGQLPKIRELLKGDVGAAFDGDPAAKSYEEIVISYPCVTAIATHRIAHELYLQDVPLIPRIMGECAHAKTGIDIHPGARIGKKFFIDHGTGVVIGETTVIGENVKIYQGTTLGALSFPKDERGRIIKGGKRHPTIEDNVTIYAEATILGDVVIGENAVVGGNVWLKKSVPAGVTVTATDAEPVYTKTKSEIRDTK